MARDHARVNWALWGDDDFLDLTGNEQRLFMLLWTSPGLTYCGGGNWHPGRIAQLCADWDTNDVLTAGAGLSKSLFLLVDTDTEEYLIRSWIKYDGLWKTPNMAVSMANARAELASRKLRGVVVHEVQKIQAANEEHSSWARPAVKSMLKQKAVNPSELDPLTPPLTPAVTPLLTLSPTPAPRVNPNPPVNPPPTPAPSPATTPTTKERATEESDNLPALSPTADAAPKKGTRIPDNWTPTRNPANLKAEQGHNTDWLELELSRFRDYWTAQPGQKGVKTGTTGWDATWRNWIRRATEYAPKTQQATMGTVDWRTA